MHSVVYRVYFVILWTFFKINVNSHFVKMKKNCIFSFPSFEVTVLVEEYLTAVYCCTFMKLLL